MNTPNDLWRARFYLNMARIKGLVSLFDADIDQLKATNRFPSEGARADIGRTIVVFLHATFEDVLRTMARQIIAASESGVLDHIPLVGTSRAGRVGKLHLGALNAHRAKTVDQLIQESVERYFDTVSFGSCERVDVILTQMGLDTAPFKLLYSDLDQMMKRRHRIVHEADLLSPSDSNAAPWTIADHFQLGIWMLVVLAFHAQLAVSVDPTDELQRFYLARRLRAIEVTRAAREETATLNLQGSIAKLGEVRALLVRPSVEELAEIFMKTKSPDYNVTEEEVRAALRKEL